MVGLDLNGVVERLMLPKYEPFTFTVLRASLGTIFDFFYVLNVDASPRLCRSRNR